MKRILGRKLRWKRKPAFLRTTLWLKRIVEKISGKAVMQGPFKGMRFGPDDGPSYMPQLLGTYEMELAGTIEDLLAQPFDRLINAGAGIGYFAVGLALRTRKEVIAYEGQEDNHPRLGELAGLNEVRDLIDQRGFCTAESLQCDLEGAAKPLLFMDVESAEEMLLDPQAVPALAKTTILVETHDFLVPHITADLIKRFAKTHQVESILTKQRILANLPKEVPVHIRPLLRTAMREHRGTQQTWLLMTPM